jgi:hypothetical protein
MEGLPVHHQLEEATVVGEEEDDKLSWRIILSKSASPLVTEGNADFQRPASVFGFPVPGINFLATFFQFHNQDIPTPAYLT